MAVTYQCDFEQVSGCDDVCIDYGALEVPVHRAIIEPLSALRDRALASGFELTVASGYRNFERQLLIWNRKARGEMPVFDDNGTPLDLNRLSLWQRVQVILRWSALPGASRHHWGTDIDVYDRAAVPPDYHVQLSIEEVAEEGPFAAMHHWLDASIAAGAAEGFFRPYDRDRGGVAPERWHLSYAPIARQFERYLSADRLKELLAPQSLELKDVVLSNLEQIIERYVKIPEYLVR